MLGSKNRIGEGVKRGLRLERGGSDGDT